MLSADQKSAYLSRIGVSEIDEPSLAELTRLQLAHLHTVPFENLDVFLGNRVEVTNEWTFDKIVHQQRGGWCFEANGAFAQLLESCGYQVQRLGAAVLLAGPTTIIDHLVLEVTIDQPYLVEVGFGDRAPIEPLPLQASGPIETLAGTFEFLASPQGTTLAQHVDGVPEARYRFKRVNHAPRDFEGASNRLQSNRTLHWSTRPFATKVLASDGTRLTLTADALKTRGPAGRHDRSVSPHEWSAVLREHFELSVEVPPESLTGAQD